jgi:hypothetical protein
MDGFLRQLLLTVFSEFCLLSRLLVGDQQSYPICRRLDRCRRTCWVGSDTGKLDNIVSHLGAVRNPLELNVGRTSIKVGEGLQGELVGCLIPLLNRQRNRHRSAGCTFDITRTAVIAYDGMERDRQVGSRHRSGLTWSQSNLCIQPSSPRRWRCGPSRLACSQYANHEQR